MKSPPLWTQDFWQWTQQQSEYLRKGDWEGLDIEHLVEELEALGRSEQRELGSFLKVLLMHLLKWHYQPEKRTQSWSNTILNSRLQIQDCLEDTPSLSRLLEDPAWLEKYYRRARRDAARETQRPETDFPAQCPYLIAQILDPNFEGGTAISQEDVR